MKTLFKIGKLCVWVSGSNSEPYSNLYFDLNYGKIKYNPCNYKSINIFPYISRHKCYTTDPNEKGRKYFQWKEHPEQFYYFYWKYGLSNQTPKFIQKYLEYKQEWKRWSDQFWGDGIIEDPKTGFQMIDPNYVMPKRPIFLIYLLCSIQKEIKQRKCRHLNMECASDISPDSGSEILYCSDCGYHQHIIYY